MENRKRNVHLHVMVTPDELAAIHERMAEAGISNAGAYVRKMALNGYILHIDLAPVKELISLQRRCSNNLNQVAIHAHTYGVYPEEIDGLKRDYEKLWGEVSKVLRELSELVAKEDEGGRFRCWDLPPCSFYHLYLCFRKCNSRSPASLQIDDRIFSISSRVELSHSASSRS